MKRKFQQVGIFPNGLSEECPSVVEFRRQVQHAVINTNVEALAKCILSLSGNRLENGSLSRGDASLWLQASKVFTQTANEGALIKISNQDKRHRDMSSLFPKYQIPLESIVNIADYLDTGEKLQLAVLNKAWNNLSEAHYFWECLDPFPVQSFSKYNDLKAYMTKHKNRLIGCRSLQMPRIPTSFKLFKDIFVTMPLLDSISLHNIIGCVSLRHCILQCPNPANMVQLSIGLSTRLSAAEISYALNCFANLQAFSFGFWQDYKAETGSFAGLGASIGSLKSLKHLSLSQSILYPENYDINTDELNDSLFMRLSSGCPDLRDVHLGSFYAVTPLTWTALSDNCPKLRSLSIEDCGICLTLDAIDAFKTMAAKSLRYLTVIPRSLGNSSRFLPSAPGCYLADNAMTELLHLASTSGTLDLFLKHDVNTNISAPIETYIDHCHATKKRYNKLVRLGHIAALRMYDEQQLLSSSYFHSDNDSV